MGAIEDFLAVGGHPPPLPPQSHYSFLCRQLSTGGGAGEMYEDDREVPELAGAYVSRRIRSTCSRQVEGGYEEHTQTYGYGPYTEAKVGSL